MTLAPALPPPRGPVSAAVLHALVHDPDLLAQVPDVAAVDPAEVLLDEDLQLALWVLYALHFRGFAEVDQDREWDARVLGLRARLEVPLERALRGLAAPALARAESSVDRVAGSPPDPEAVVERLRGVVAAAGADGPDLARHVQRRASREQLVELLVLRSVYTLKESDPTALALPRLDGPAKAALAELLYDEYGGGRPERLHATMYAAGMRSVGLDTTYAAYVDHVPGHVLAVDNAQSLFGLHRRLRGAALGHLAAFEATSSLPCRRIAAGVRRLGMPEELWAYFDEHVEADAVHEQVALREVCGALVVQEPELLADVLLGAAVCGTLEGLSGAATLTAWEAGRSALRRAHAGARAAS